MIVIILIIIIIIIIIIRRRIVLIIFTNRSQSCVYVFFDVGSLETFINANVTGYFE